MIYPISAYGDPVLRQESEDISPDYPELQKLIDDMFETMYHAEGVGIAAPQVGKAIRLFVVDTTPMTEDDDDELDLKAAFINPEILEYYGDEWSMQEGCLSIPGIHENVSRPEFIKIHYFDENFVEHTKVFEGYAARVIQHEYDHLDGEMFIDHVNALRKRMIKSKLMNIAKGNVRTSYRMVPPKK
ncbi:MAG: peptide deformylase [Mangrovibacterium sp.]